MLNYLRDLYEGLMDVYRNRRDGPSPPRSLLDAPPPAPPPAKPAAPPPAPVPAVRGTLAPLKNWAHPFGDKSNPLVQLTNLSKAVAGYYPIGRGGLWHGGVHFDSGTAGILKQDHVRCLADGEVVAYRIAANTPRTAYHTKADELMEAPFASGFVLVRHHLQAPKLENSPDIPPSLIFYSLYMHLQDWKSYEDDPKLARPAFWKSGSYRVKPDTTDPGPLGTSVLAQPKPGGKVLKTLPRGTAVTISGTGDFCKLVSADGIDLPPLGPKNPALGYIRMDALESTTGRYRVKDDALGKEKCEHLNVHAEAKASSKVIATLPRGAEVVVSGEGEYRKLENVLAPESASSSADDFHAASGYLRFSALEPIILPHQLDTVAILEPPIAIKAGELIGHLGPYQTSKPAPPVYKLHLETFTAENLPKFFQDSRTWADRLPAKEKTWLKLAKGTDVVTTSTGGPPSVMRVGTPSGYTLLVPRSLLDGLGAANKRVVAGEAFNWYRLEGLLLDAADKPLDGWVCERVGTTPWVSPWHWDGYEIINDYGPLASSLAYSFNVRGLLTDDEVERLRPHIDAWDQGPLQTRLYDIIDSNRDGKLSPDEMQAALAIPAKAQSLSQLVINYESEWHYRQQKWDDLDDVQGHTPSTPFLNWMAEKERIRELKWWSDVAGRVGLPEGGRVYHLHPIGLLGNFVHGSDDEFMHLAMTIYGEARGQSYESKIAVGWVIRNRLATGRWGKTYKLVVTARLQFTCWSQAVDPQGYAAIHNPVGLAWEDCKSAAREVMSASDDSNPLPGAVNYYSPTAQAQLHAVNPSTYPATPPFAIESKRVPNPAGVRNEDYRFYKN
ncbi:cell wall hydrolase [Pseudomonas sp. PDM20]|uniref:cell wall hydrolase n=1 Tax=Pseudomonas sp. PDM20 TaxID=2769254 RepID=UPI00177E0F3B|nr:cell wall hydrolase [Pseudomonas sp. PDM20]MBD9684756.1 cell wall hydrolase [Pseudomonas sp. PDM20]